MGAALRDRVVAFAGVTSTVGGDAANILALRDQAEQIGQDRRVADMAPVDLDGPDLQCFLMNSEMDLVPDTAFRATMFARMPLAFAFALDLDTSAVDQQVQRAFRSTVGVC